MTTFTIKQLETEIMDYLREKQEILWTVEPLNIDEEKRAKALKKRLALAIAGEQQIIDRRGRSRKPSAVADPDELGCIICGVVLAEKSKSGDHYEHIAPHGDTEIGKLCPDCMEPARRKVVDV